MNMEEAILRIFTENPPTGATARSREDRDFVNEYKAHLDRQRPIILDAVLQILERGAVSAHLLRCSRVRIYCENADHLLKGTHKGMSDDEFDQAIARAKETVR
jgi:hypothetical protein